MWNPHIDTLPLFYVNTVLFLRAIELGKKSIFKVCQFDNLSYLNLCFLNVLFIGFIFVEQQKSFGWYHLPSQGLFSRVHATLYVTMSVGWSVGRSVQNHFAPLHFFWCFELKGG